MTLDLPSLPPVARPAWTVVTDCRNCGMEIRLYPEEPGIWSHKHTGETLCYPKENKS